MIALQTYINSLRQIIGRDSQTWPIGQGEVLIYETGRNIFSYSNGKLVISCGPEDIVEVLQDRGADMDMVRAELHKTVSLRVFAAEQVHRSATQFFGQEFVDQSIQDWDAFNTRLVKAVQSAMKPEQKAPLEIMKGGRDDYTH